MNNVYATTKKHHFRPNIASEIVTWFEEASTHGGIGDVSSEKKSDQDPTKWKEWVGRSAVKWQVTMFA